MEFDGSGVGWEGVEQGGVDVGGMGVGWCGRCLRLGRGRMQCEGSWDGLCLIGVV